MPGQSGANNRVEIRDLGAPAEQLGCESGIGDQDRRIARPSCGFAARDRFAADRLGSPDHLAHRVTAAGAKIECHALPPGAEMFQRAQMGIGEVLDVNVVANRRPIRRRVIGSVDFDLRPLSERRPQNERDEMRLRFVPFTDLALGIGAGSIEITQRHPPQYQWSARSIASLVSP
jgi:hypothetical protein